MDECEGCKQYKATWDRIWLTVQLGRSLTFVTVLGGTYPAKGAFSDLGDDHGMTFVRNAPGETVILDQNLSPSEGEKPRTVVYRYGPNGTDG